MKVKNAKRGLSKMALSVSFVATIVFGAAIPPTNAQVRGVTVAVDGMSCPFCAFGVEKKLKEVEGVESVTVDLKSGTATLAAKDGESLRVDQVPGAIKKAGFTPGKIQIEARGTLGLDDQQRLLIRMTGSEQTFLLVHMKGNIEDRLRVLAKGNSLVEVTGIFLEGGDGLSTVTAERVEEVSK